MWSQNKIWLSVCALLVLTGCGFSPLYSKNPSRTADSRLLVGVLVDPIKTTDRRSGQLLKADLEDRLNPQGAVPANPLYRLDVSLVQSTAAIGVAPDGSISRYNVYLNSTYSLFRRSDNRLMNTGSVSQVSSFNNVANAYYSTYVSQEDSVARGLTELSEMYRQRISAYLSENNGNPQPKVVEPMDKPMPQLQNMIQTPGLNQ